MNRVRVLGMEVLRLQEILEGRPALLDLGYLVYSILYVTDVIWSGAEWGLNPQPPASEVTTHTISARGQ